MPTETFHKLNPDKKQKIIRCAIENFAHNGYTGTSMDSVAECAKVAKGALYRYFTSKKDLYMLVVDNLVDDIDRYAQEFIESHSTNNAFETFRDHMVSIHELYKRFSVHQQVLCNILYQEELEFKGEVLAKFGKLTTQYTRLVLQRGIARGEIREDIDLDAAGFVIESVTDRFHDGTTMPYLDHGFGLYQQPQEVINRKADQIIESFRRAFGKLNPDTGDFVSTVNKSGISRISSNMDRSY
ncbi:MAG TPA: TetR/AcrR family transcriptional regulator [archaeon]|nr:TetR/AcrR family transcriptional regulator [archaeon]